MSSQAAIRWLKTTFQNEIEAAIRGTPFTLDMVAAIAYQETGYLWEPLIARTSPQELLKVCVGDTIDAPKRSAFPKTKAELLRAPRGAEMFAIAREALAAIGVHDRAYRKIAATQPNKFCHGFGIFQYDLQFYLQDPEFFLQRRWHDFSACLTIFLQELHAAKARAFGPRKTALTDQERVFVAIAYNRGKVDFARGFKQGHKDSEGRFYGEKVLEFLRVSQAVTLGPVAGIVDTVRAGLAVLARPTPVEAIGDVFMVEVREHPLRLRSQPKVPRADANANVIARLPDGQLVTRVAGRKGDTFYEVEANLNGAHFRGFAAAEFLVPVKKATAVTATREVSQEAPTEGLIGILMPRSAGSITTRAAPAGAHSLNEPNQPGRVGTSAAERCAELAAIIAWLAVDKPAHRRYQPTSTATFCNIYAHDYCHLAGAYLPRVWWSPGAIERISRGEKVTPLYGNTIDEQRANALFTWLRDFGPRFGWRQTSTLTKLQEAANLGGLGLIVAKRKVEGRSGHIVMVAPETDTLRARRDNAGEVVAPLQSQAGSVNFRYNTGKLDWWKGVQFADSAFWIHA